MLRRLSGDLAGGDARGERRDDGRLADAGIADEERVVLGAPLEDLQQPADLDVAADDRVEAPLARALGEIPGVLLGAGSTAAGELGRQPGGDDVTRDARERGHVRPERARSEPEGLEDHRRRAADLLGERVEQVLDADRSRLGRFLLRPGQQREHGARQVGETARALRQARELGLHLGRDLHRLRASLLEDRGHAGITLDGAREQVDGLDLRMLALVGEGLAPPRRSSWRRERSEQGEPSVPRASPARVARDRPGWLGRWMCTAAPRADGR